MVLNISDPRKREIILVISSGNNYASNVNQLLDFYFSDKSSFGIYLNLNKSYAPLIKALDEKKVSSSRILIIDAVTPLKSEESSPKNVISIGNPKSLTDISIAATTAMESVTVKNKFLVIDSVSSLVVYNEVNTVLKFSRFLINKMKEEEFSGLILSVEKGKHDFLLTSLSQICDRVLELN